MKITFHAVNVTVEADSPKAAYDELCRLLTTTWFETSTFSSGANPEQRPMDPLFVQLPASVMLHASLARETLLSLEDRRVMLMHEVSHSAALQVREIAARQLERVNASIQALEAAVAAVSYPQN